MPPMFTLIIICLLVLGAVGYVCRRRMELDRRTGGRLGRAAAAMIWAVYLSFTALAVFVAWHGVWPLLLPEWIAWGAGAAFLALGMALMAGGALAFGSVARMSGRRAEKLVQNGVYRWTRNPQNMGWGAALLGVALCGRSGAALVMAALFLVAFRLYVPIEERYLESTFGEEWRRYQRSTPRFFGVPLRPPARASKASRRSTATLDIGSA